MSRMQFLPVVASTAALALFLFLFRAADGQTVWSGFDHSFTKSQFVDPTQPENQDRLTENVWLTRANSAGLFNARTETSYSASSPADTEWATGLLAANAGKTISAENWANLTFDSWVNAFMGGGRQLPSNLLSHNAVLHLISDDIYVDIQFTDWSVQGAGGFSYDRGTGTVLPPETTGDYNRDGVVDAADYVEWRATLDQSVAFPGAGADGNANGMVDADDYDFWRAHFGEIVTEGAGEIVAVPEPISSTLLALLAATLSCRRCLVLRTCRGVGA